MSVFSPRQEKAIKKRIQTEFEGPSKFWKQQVLGKFTLCPYCGEIGANLGTIEDMVEEQFHHFVTKCSGWGNWQGELITLNRLQNMALEIEIKHKLVNDPLWHYFDQGGNWYCPSCAQPIPTRYHKFKKLDLKSIKLIQEHCMYSCQNSKRGRLQKFIEANFLKRTVSIANAAIKLVPEIQQLMKTDYEWTKKSPDGTWICPFCFEVLEKIDISTKFNMLEKAPEIAIHMVTRCVKFQNHYKKHKKCKIDYTLDSAFLNITEELKVASKKEEFQSNAVISIAHEDLPDFLKPAPKEEKPKAPVIDQTVTASQRGTAKQIQVTESYEKLYAPKETLNTVVAPNVPVESRLAPTAPNITSTPPTQQPYNNLPHLPNYPRTQTTPQENTTDAHLQGGSIFDSKAEIKDGIMEVYAVPAEEMTEENYNAQYGHYPQEGQMSPPSEKGGFYDEDTFANAGEEEYEISGSFSNLPLFQIQPGTQTLEDYLPDWMSSGPEEGATAPLHSQFSSDLHKPFSDKDSNISAPLQKEQEEDIFRILDNELFLESTFKLKAFRDSKPVPQKNTKPVSPPEVSSSPSTPPSVQSSSPSSEKTEKSSGGTSRKIVRRIKKVLKVDPALMPKLNQIIPKIPPDLPFEMKTFFKPSPLIGGDFYDIYQLDDTQFVFSISSTSLSGQASIDLNAKVSALLREHISAKSLVSSLSRINEILYNVLGSSHYLSLFVGILDMSSWKIRFSNAGHNSLLICNLRSKNIRTVSTNGIVMGGNQDSFFRTVLSEEEVQLTPETIMIQYTTGSIEQRNEARQPWGFQALYQLIAQNASLGVDALLKSIENEVKNYTKTQPQKEDCLVLAIRL